MKISVFTKIFAYTMLLLLLMSMAAVLLFARQFLSFYRDEQQRRLSRSFQPILALMSDREKNIDEILEAAEVFANSNQSFKFHIQEGNGNVIFTTMDMDDIETIMNNSNVSLRMRFMGMTRNLGEGPSIAGPLSEGPAFGYIFTGYSSEFARIQYGDLIRRSLLALGLMLMIALLGAVLFAKGVTKPLEEEILRERAMEENQRLFFSAASHELKTPIAAARALVEGMIAGVEDFKDHRKYLRECLKTLDSQTRLVSEILEIVKLSDADTGLADAESQAISLDLGDLGNTVLTEYRPLAEQRGLLIQGDFPSVSIKANRNLLQRVLSNVIANAVQNTPEGGTICIEALEGKNLHLSITNTGARIPEEVISRLFEPFYRLDTARTRHGTQSGLGLVIVKRALDRMGFPFALENSNDGVVFWVELSY